MYKLTLILKYLRRKLGPMFAAAAVMLCTAMVIMVISVMGGFLDMLQSSAKKLTGDVSVISQSMTGFAYYEELARNLEALPEVESTTSVVSAFGMVNLYGRTIGVNIMGIDPESFTQIVPYKDTLHWSAQDFTERYGYEPDDPATRIPGIDFQKMGMTLQHASTDLPGIVIGIEVNPRHRRDKHGQYDFIDSAINHEATLTVLPLTEHGAPAEMGPRYSKAAVVNEFKSGLYDIDRGQVFVKFAVLQKLLDMDRTESKAFDPETGETVPGKVSVKPARTSEVVVKGAEGYTLSEVEEAIKAEVSRFAEKHPDQFRPAVRTWEQRHEQFISAVRNEKGMVTFLFVIISIVAVFMVGVTFYMTVLEKTRDIGVLRAVGASQPGIIGMYLGYGLFVGAIGAFSGLLLATLGVIRLNSVQFWLANYLGVTSHFAWSAVGLGLLGAIVGGLLGFRKRRFIRTAALYGAVSGILGLAIAWGILLAFPDLAAQLNEMIKFKMWDPQTYFFDRIPARIDPLEAGVIVIGMVIASVIGALIPAVIAAELDPVETLRYE